MKTKTKKLLFGAAGGLLLCGGIWTAGVSRQGENDSKMLRANIEAMADGEVEAGYVKDIIPRNGTEPGSWTKDGSKFCVPYWESIECWNETPDGKWCQSSYHRGVHCY